MVEAHKMHGSRWSEIAKALPRRCASPGVFCARLFCDCVSWLGCFVRGIVLANAPKNGQCDQESLELHDASCVATRCVVCSVLRLVASCAYCERERVHARVRFYVRWHCCSENSGGRNEAFRWGMDLDKTL